MDLSGLIADKIVKEGPMNFRDFMEMALYYPGMGYYSSYGQKIGRSGDYFTSAYLTRLFGVLLAKQIEEMWQLMGGGSFTVVEYGAGTGMLCRDILESLKENEQLYSRLDYYIIERSNAMREAERAVVPDKAKWVDDISELMPLTACILSNELLDNFPVHRVFMADELMEVWVTFEDGFREILRPAPPALAAYLEQMEIVLSYGSYAEIDLEATEWIEKLAADDLKSVCS